MMDVRSKKGLALLKQYLAVLLLRLLRQRRLKAGSFTEGYFADLNGKDVDMRWGLILQENRKAANTRSG